MQSIHERGQKPLDTFDIEKLYGTNKDFHDYVNRYMASRNRFGNAGCIIPNIFTHSYVREAAEYYYEREKENEKNSKRNSN